MRPETISILQSPRTKEALRLEGSPGAALVGVETGQRFELRDGVPVFVREEELGALNRRYRRFYRVAAPFYDWAIRQGARLGRRDEAETRRSFLAELSPMEGNRLLEVSVGTGSNLRLLPEDLELHGLDLSWPMLRRCRREMRRLGRHVDLVLGNAEHLPYRDEVFDAVLHVGGINAFDDRAAALAEMLRVARPAARVVVVDETAALLEKLTWLPGTKRAMRELGDRLSAPVDLVPQGAVDVESHPVAGGDLYCLTFRKRPRAEATTQRTPPP